MRHIEFNIQVFNALATRAFKAQESHPYTLEEVLNVFEYYFASYEYEFGKPHPNIRMTQISSIIERMPYMGDINGDYMDLAAECYEDMIDQHFETEYKSDYNINHFFSGDIRLLRFYETCY